MEKDEALSRRAAAAAKLVLQEIDPIAKQKRQAFSNGPAQGQLCNGSHRSCV